MNPRAMPDNLIVLNIAAEGNTTSLQNLRDIGVRTLRAQLPDCWTLTPDDAAGVTLAHAASACERGCRVDDTAAVADGSTHYPLPDLLRVILLSALGIRVATYDEARAAIPDGNLSA